MEGRPSVEAPETRYARSGEAVVSSTVRDLVAGSGIEFEDRGSHSLKGVQDEWHLYRVRS
jgi:class 3 adenylate cyclase